MVRIALVTCLLAVSALADKHPLIGEWKLVLERPGMQPRLSRATLKLDRLAGQWSGEIRFRMILYGRPHETLNLKVVGKSVSFFVSEEDFHLDFSGFWKRPNLGGTCRWITGFPKRTLKYRWRATRRGYKAPPIDEGLEFGKDFPQGKLEGIDRGALDALLRTAEDSSSSAVVIVQNGKVITERHFGGKPRPIHTMSVTKFLTAMAIGYLLDDKKIKSLDDPLSTWFPEWERGMRGKVTLRHVMAHTSGIAHDKLATKLNRHEDKVAWCANTRSRRSRERSSRTTTTRSRS